MWIGIFMRIIQLFCGPERGGVLGLFGNQHPKLQAGDMVIELAQISTFFGEVTKAYFHRKQLGNSWIVILISRSFSDTNSVFGTFEEFAWFPHYSIDLLFWISITGKLKRKWKMRWKAWWKRKAWGVIQLSRDFLNNCSIPVAINPDPSLCSMWHKEVWKRSNGIMYELVLNGFTIVLRLKDAAESCNLNPRVCFAAGILKVVLIHRFQAFLSQGWIHQACNCPEEKPEHRQYLFFECGFFFTLPTSSRQVK